ncbi:MAG: hypothetical protein RR859_09050, partial [Ruthenibacterium sp.]
PYRCSDARYAGTMRSDEGVAPYGCIDESCVVNGGTVKTVPYRCNLKIEVFNQTRFHAHK